MRGVHTHATLAIGLGGYVDVGFLDKHGGIQSMSLL